MVSMKDVIPKIQIKENIIKLSSRIMVLVNLSSISFYKGVYSDHYPKGKPQSRKEKQYGKLCRTMGKRKRRTEKGR